MEPVIGLEIHVQLKTYTKLFCGCQVAFGDPPNSHTCPVCLGLPGALPAPNAEAVGLGVRAAMAVNCTINRVSQFARKNYFYPDLPKGYQISQYDRPLAERGHLDVGEPPVRVRLTRLHLEEDAGKSLHEGFPDSADKSYLDLNRCGVPLAEIVTEPDIGSPALAYEFLTRLKTTLQYIGVSDCNMEEGSLRCDANVSLRTPGGALPTYKVEIKNLNSFRNVQRALEYEIDRQRKILEEGARVPRETRLYDADRGVTVSMRSKEEAHDYRYFPEPDLLPIEVSEEQLDAIRKTLPELPGEKIRRLISEYQIPAYDAGVLASSIALAEYFETCARESGNAKAASNWVMTEVLRELKNRDTEIADFALSAARLARLIRRIDDGTITGKAAKEVFAAACESGDEIDDIIRQKGLTQIQDDSTIESVIVQVIQANPKPVQQYRAGKTATLGFLVGQVMKATAGRASPQKVTELLRRALS